MAIFGLKKRNTEKKGEADSVAKAPGKASKATKPEKVAKKSVASTGVVASAVAHVVSSDITESIIRLHITEKSGIMSQGGVYTFEISRKANKNSVSKAVTSLYKITPLRVNIINLPTKNVFVKGRHGTVSGIRKAMVTLKKGDKIDFV